MALETVNFGGSENKKLPKKFGPGNHTVKLNSLSLEDYTFIPGAKHIVLNLETEAIEGFEGFFLDPSNPEGGRHEGQVGRVKASEYAFANGKTKKGDIIDRDTSILLFLSNLCRALKVEDWFKAQNNKHDTIEDFIEAFNTEAPFKNKFFKACIGGKEYTDKNGYTAYNLRLVKSENGFYNIVAIDSDKVVAFDEQRHIVKQTTTPMSEGFTVIPPTGNTSNFSL